LTPLLNVEQLHRSLYPVRRLRERYGLRVEGAMQDDVNGISWLFADLLPAVGINFLTLAVNPVRGGAPKPRPSAFWWEGPAGGRILVWNGYHYLFGRSTFKLGDWRFVERFLPRWLKQLEQDPHYPYDFLYCEATHPLRVDNGPPDRRISDFVRAWNESGRTPRMVITTLTEFGRRLLEEHGASLPTWRGDWLDWWCDGVASSAYETGLNRTTHELLLAAEAMGAWLHARGRRQWSAERLAHVYEQMTLYDEHTWGAFSSIVAPESLFTKAQWNRKASFAYTAAMETHDVLARAARELAEAHGDLGTEGVFNLGDLPPEEAYPPSGATELLVINTLPWTRPVLVEEPELRGGAAPVGMLEMFFPRDVPWNGARPPTPLRRVVGHVPGLGYAFLPLAAAPKGEDLQAGPNVIENAYYRVRIDPSTGALAEWVDKELGSDFAGRYRGWSIGQYVYELVDSDRGRDALFEMDFAHEDFGVWRTDTPFRQATATEVHVHPPAIEHGRASITVEIKAPGVRHARCTYALETHAKTLAIDWLLDKEHVTDPEAVFIAFPFKLGRPIFRADLNGVPCTPDEDQLPGTVRDWYPIHRWVDVSDGQRGVTLVPLDAPLVHLGGITTGRWMARLAPEGPTIMSWALNNHWMVNFKASQGGQIPLRYRLTTHAGPCDDVAAARFGAEVATPPIVLRDYLRRGASSGRFVSIPEDAGVLLTAKPAENGDGIIVRLQNLRPEAQVVPLEFPEIAPASARRTSPVETDDDPLEVRDGVVLVPIAARAVQSVRITF
ncbi:MAG TPA: glycoside hydrolase family 38 C-terminal domain-containing protein, partial [Chloroflexota bacterium]